MSYQFINEVHAGSSDGSTLDTSGADFTGATHLVAIISYNPNTGHGSISGANGTWNQVLVREWGPIVRAFAIYECHNPSGDLSNVVFSVGFQNNQKVSIIVLGFSGGSDSPTDQAAYNDSTSGGASTSGQATSITPSQDNCLVVAGLSEDTSDTVTIDSGFSTVYRVNTDTNHFGVAGAYKIQTSAAAVAPTFSWSTSQPWIIGQSSFLPEATSPATYGSSSPTGSLYT